MRFLWKVCGMRDEQNIKDVAALQPDFIGFIFFGKSKRYVGEDFDAELLNHIPAETKKVGVFVDETSDEVLAISNQYHLDYAQLHGNESAEYCELLKSKGLGVIKAFAIDHSFDFLSLGDFEGKVDYFLFDTKAKGGHGGHGVSFDWTLLDQYKLDVPFLLAGGIYLDNLSDVKKLNFDMLVGVDVNSKFELRPAFKNLEMLRELKELLKLF